MEEITRKYKKRFTVAELNDYLTTFTSIKGGQTEEVDEAWRKLGYINASAYKGYGELSKAQKNYNSRIYHVKEQSILYLAQHTDDIKTFDGVLYIRTLSGIQISFHLNINNPFRRTDELEELHLRYFDKSVVWDGVEESYTYNDIKAYNEARAEYQCKVKAERERRIANISILRSAILKTLDNHMTRKHFGLPAKKREWLEYFKALNFRVDSASSAVIIIGKHAHYDEMADLERRILSNLPQNWNEMCKYKYI